jgi:Leucine-rich repeat (LRR) protein
MMCEKLGQACACRLALTLGRMEALREVDISGNAFDVLPDSLLALPLLERLNISGESLADSLASTSPLHPPPCHWCIDNSLREIPVAVSKLVSLRVLDARNNVLQSLPVESLAQLQHLEEVLVEGNESIPPVELQAVLKHTEANKRSLGNK